jgi:hypothetical protein
MVQRQVTSHHSRKPVNDPKPDIVARVAILQTRIAETDD